MRTSFQVANCCDFSETKVLVHFVTNTDSETWKTTLSPTWTSTVHKMLRFIFKVFFLKLFTLFSCSKPIFWKFLATLLSPFLIFSSLITSYSLWGCIPSRRCTTLPTMGRLLALEVCVAVGVRDFLTEIQASKCWVLFQSKLAFAFHHSTKNFR